jgi:hypothetical protein
MKMLDQADIMETTLNDAMEGDDETATVEESAAEILKSVRGGAGPAGPAVPVMMDELPSPPNVLPLDLQQRLDKVLDRPTA